MTDKEKLRLYRDTLRWIIKHENCKKKYGYAEFLCFRSIIKDVKAVLKQK